MRLSCQKHAHFQKMGRVFQQVIPKLRGHRPEPGSKSEK